MSDVARAILAGHGDFATGLLSAVAQIIGTSEAFIPLSNRDLSAADVERVMRSEAERHAVRIIFTDLPAGSCTMAARRLQREMPDVLVVTGTNLATLLDFAFHGDLSDSDAIHHAVDKGRASLVISGAPGGR